MSAFSKHFSKIILGSLLVVGVLGLAACGPEQSALDKEAEQIEQRTRKLREQLRPAVGTYRGEAKTFSGKTWVAVLEIWPASKIVTNPSRGDTTEIPTLGGALVTLDSQGEPFVIANYTNGTFSRTENRVRLSGTFTTGDISLDGELKDGFLTGRAFQPWGTIDFRLEKDSE